MENSTQLIEKIKPFITDISSVYSLKQLKMFEEAIFSKAEVIVKKGHEAFINNADDDDEEIDYENINRKKIRIDVTKDISFIAPIIEHLESDEEIVLKEIKTGLSVKHVNNGYSTNIVNYNELRTINGIVFGNFYLNVIRNEEEYELLNISRDVEWFRGYVMIKVVCIYDVIEYLTDENIKLLKAFSKRGNKRRLSNANKLVEEKT